MNHKDRLAAVMNGHPVDRPPVSVWGHDFLREWSASDLASQTIENQASYDYDLVKVMVRWTLFPEAWGNRYEPPVEQRFPRLLFRVVRSADDLNRLPVVDADHPALREHVEAMQIIVSAVGDDVDCVATLFSPLAVLGLIAGGVGHPLIDMAREQPKATHTALEHITDTLIAHARELLSTGASGVFFAPLQWTSLNVCPSDFYAEFGEPYDRALLTALPDACFKILHACGDNIDLKRFFDYPVDVLNWDNFSEDNPGLHEVAQESGKIVAGGIPHLQLGELGEEALLPLVRDAVEGLDSGFILAGGCVIDPSTTPLSRAAVVDLAHALAAEG